MAWWNRNKEQRDVSQTGSAPLSFLSTMLDPSQITKDQAMEVPAVAMAVNLISDIVASLPIRLMQLDIKNDKVTPIEDDSRLKLLNLETGDTLNSYQWKKAMVEDYLMSGAGYSYINKSRNVVKSLNYVNNDLVGVVVTDPNPIFKKMEILVYGESYKEFQFIKLVRKTKDGVHGIGVIDENNKILSVAYNQMVFEDLLYRTGGNKKGFLKAQNRLSPDAMTALKNAFANLYQNNTENVIVLNNGIEFQEANNSSVEMQVNQNKVANDQAIAKIFGMPYELMNGKATGGNELLFDSFVKLAILPILKAFETALNRDLLLDKEKSNMYFQFNADDISRADILKRYTAYDFAVKNGILQVDEIRKMENVEPLGFDYIKLGLQDVLYNPTTKEIYTPNTNRLAKMGEQVEGANGTGSVPNVPVVGENPPTGNNPPLKGGENKNESGNQK